MATVVDGIAQGTVLGPILFIFYINDVINRMKYVNITLFVDDCIIYLSGNNWESVHRKIQCDFDAIVDWTGNNLRLNYDTTKAMLFNTRNRILNLTDPTPFSMRNINIRFVKCHVYLGVTLDCAMMLDPLIKTLIKRVTNKLSIVHKIMKFITKDVPILI